MLDSLEVHAFSNPHPFARLPLSAVFLDYRNNIVTLSHLQQTIRYFHLSKKFFAGNDGRAAEYMCIYFYGIADVARHKHMRSVSEYDFYGRKCNLSKTHHINLITILLHPRCHNVTMLFP